VGIVAVLLLSAGLFWRTQATRYELQQTYFSYTQEETAALTQDTPPDINLNDIYLWDQKAFRLVSNNKIGDVDASRIYAYLSVAQRDFAVLSYNASGQYLGDISSISQKVLCTFFTKDCGTLSLNEAKGDALSEGISSLVMKRVEERIAKDAAAKPFTLRTGKDLWSGQQPSIGIDAMNRLPWHLSSADEYRPAAPPQVGSETLKDELAATKKALTDITEDQRASVVFWAGGPGTKTPPGIWLNIADQHMKDNDTELETVLHLHADITTAMADAVIAVFDTKYTYLQKRPYMLDGSINTVMPTPNHPSYPSGHATISGAAHTVMTHYFPAKKSLWQQTATVASNTRFWGGIHFAVDNGAGARLGEKVGAKALEQSK